MEKKKLIEKSKNLPDNTGKEIEDLKRTVDSNVANTENHEREISSLKLSVSSGKSKVATAITDKGVSTSSDASFDIMVSNIANIATGRKWASGVLAEDITFPNVSSNQWASVKILTSWNFVPKQLVLHYRTSYIGGTSTRARNISVDSTISNSTNTRSEVYGRLSEHYMQLYITVESDGFTVYSCSSISGNCYLSTPITWDAFE